MNRTRVRSFGLTDVGGALVIVAGLILFGVPTVGRLHDRCRRDRCSENLDAIGTAAKIYANDYGGLWMVPPFKRTAVDNEGIDYLAGDAIAVPPIEPGEVGYAREFESTSETFMFPDAGSTAVSVTRAFWLLVRSGALAPRQFICPDTHDETDPTVVREWYYDFSGYDNISYGYQVPFGPRGARPREGVDSRQVLAADKGPYYLRRFDPMFEVPGRGGLTLDAPAARWRRFNSPNHHGRGQNVLFADGHCSFEYTPAAGVHRDNIYTLMVDDWDGTHFNRIHGESPHHATVADYPYPGQDALGPGIFASTDSLLYP